jgi:hypothetical protein
MTSRHDGSSKRAAPTPPSAQGGAGNDTTIDASLTQANDYWNGCFIKYLTCTNAGNIGITREITDFDAGTDTLTHDAFPARTENGDTFLLSAWQLIEDGQTLSTPVESENDYVKLTASASAGNEAGYIQTPNTNSADNINISTTVYTKARFRYKTSDANIKAKIIFDYGAGGTQEVLADASSTSFTVGTADLTTAKTLDHIRLHADHATGDVYYDYVLVYKGDFTFPNVGLGINGTIPTTTPRIGIPGRQTRVANNMGSDDFTLRMRCDLTQGTWTRSGDSQPGQVFYDIAGESPSEPWQWLDTEREQMKVTLDPPLFTRDGSPETLTDQMDLLFYEYRLSDGDNAEETYVTRWGLDL